MFLAMNLFSGKHNQEDAAGTYRVDEATSKGPKGTATKYIRSRHRLVRDMEPYPKTSVYMTDEKSFSSEHKEKVYIKSEL